MLVYEELTQEILAAAIEVHKELGPGLMESAYEECLCHELSLRRLGFQRQVPLPVVYKSVKLDCGYRLDLMVMDKIIVELRSVEEVKRPHHDQLLTYLRLSGKHIGMLMNFNVPSMEDGIIRLIS